MCSVRLLLCIYSITCLMVLVACQSPAGSTLTTGVSIVSNETLVSPGGVFEVGFTSGTRWNLSGPVYTLGIWYVNADKKVVWVAPDRTLALRSSKASLTLTSLGDLQVIDNSGSSPVIAWSAGTANVSPTACS